MSAADPSDPEFLAEGAPANPPPDWMLGQGRSQPRPSLHLLRANLGRPLGEGVVMDDGPVTDADTRRSDRPRCEGLAHGSYFSMARISCASSTAALLCRT